VVGFLRWHHHIVDFAVAVVVRPVAALRARASGLSGTGIRGAVFGTAESTGAGALAHADDARFAEPVVDFICCAVAVVILPVAELVPLGLGLCAGNDPVDARAGSLGADAEALRQAWLALFGEELVRRAVAVVVRAVANLCQWREGLAAAELALSAEEKTDSAIAHAAGLTRRPELGIRLVSLAIAVIVLPITDLFAGRDEGVAAPLAGVAGPISLCADAALPGLADHAGPIRNGIVNLAVAVVIDVVTRLLRRTLSTLADQCALCTLDNPLGADTELISLAGVAHSWILFVHDVVTVIVDAITLLGFGDAGLFDVGGGVDDVRVDGRGGVSGQ